MSKLGFIFSALCLLAVSSAIAYAQAAREATVGPETRAKIVLQTRLSSKLSEVNDPVSAVLDEPIVVDGQLVIPRGTEFHGRVTQVKAARRGQKAASISIVFERISMPWGDEPVSVIVTAIDDWDKNEKLKANDEGKVSGGHRGEATADNVWRGGAIGGAAASTVILAGGSGGAGAAALGGGLLSGLFLTKGGEVHVNPGAVFRIKFVKPITLPVVGHASASPRPVQPEPERVPAFDRPPDK